jgi:hypothetical protein
MAVYVTGENQEMLWNLIHKNPQILEYFSNKTITEKTEWFKNIIRSFYYENQYKDLSIDELKQINKDTLTYMVKYIKQIVQIPISNDPMPTEEIKKTPNLENQFQNRQKEYDQMLEKPAPENITFSEKIEDTVISNMDELIKIHLEQREKELMDVLPVRPTQVEPAPTEIELLKQNVEELKEIIKELKTEVESLKKGISTKILKNE